MRTGGGKAFLCILILLAILAGCAAASRFEDGEVQGRGQQRRVSKLTRNSNNKPRGSRGVVEDDREKEKHLFNPRIKFTPFKLPPGYSPLQIPTNDAALQQYATSSAEFWEYAGGTMHSVEVYIIIRSVTGVDDVNEEITFNIDLNMEWMDYFIREGTARANNVSTDDMIHEEAFDYFERSLDPSLLKEIWKPDIIIDNLVKVQHPELISAPVSIRFNQVTGKIKYGAKLKIKMECGMDFHYYPADTQECNVAIRSSNYQSSDLSIFWESPECTAVFLEDCSESNYDIQLTGIDRNARIKESGRKRKTQTGFDVLQFKIKARRDMSYHIVQTFIPSIFFIIITWLCFLIPPSMMEGRIAIAMTTLLTLTAMFGSIRENTPNVSYIRAIDIWMLVCIILIFLTLLEFAIVLWIRHMKTELDEDDEAFLKSAEAGEMKNPLPQNSDNINVTFTTPLPDEVELRPLNAKNKDFTSKSSPESSSRRKRVMFCQGIADFLDHRAFLLFSTIFTIFNAVYWPWLLTSSNYYGWYDTIDERINCPAPPPPPSDDSPQVETFDQC